MTATDRYLTEWREALQELELALGAVDSERVERAREDVSYRAAQIVIHVRQIEWPPNVSVYL